MRMIIVEISINHRGELDLRGEHSGIAKIKILLTMIIHCLIIVSLVKVAIISGGRILVSSAA
jgi:hypothetical protein